MTDFVAEVRKWFDAIAVARLDGFQFGYCEEGLFLGLGRNLFFVEYGEKIIQRGLDAALVLLKVEEEQAGG